MTRTEALQEVILVLENWSNKVPNLYRCYCIEVENRGGYNIFLCLRQKIKQIKGAIAFTELSKVNVITLEIERMIEELENDN